MSVFFFILEKNGRKAAIDFNLNPYLSIPYI